MLAAARVEKLTRVRVQELSSDALGTSPRTVRNQMTSILDKTGAASRTELTRFVLQRG